MLCIRPLRPDDRLLDQLMDIDYRQRMAFVATTQQDGVQQVVGVARYCQTDDDGTAELGVSVGGAWQRSGIASLLMEQLIRYAREQGIRRLIGLALPDNRPMIALARRLAFTVSYEPAQHLFRMSRELDAAQPSQVAAASCCSMHPRRASGAS